VTLAPGAGRWSAATVRSPIPALAPHGYAHQGQSDISRSQAIANISQTTNRTSGSTNIWSRRRTTCIRE
jgi:hypothetical protein